MWTYSGEAEDAGTMSSGWLLGIRGTHTLHLSAGACFTLWGILWFVLKECIGEKWVAMLF